jgi:hypothetical protein
VQEDGSGAVDRWRQVGRPARHDEKEGADPVQVLGGSSIAVYVELTLLASSPRVRGMRNFRPTPEAKKKKPTKKKPAGTNKKQTTKKETR